MVECQKIDQKIWERNINHEKHEDKTSESSINDGNIWEFKREKAQSVASVMLEN